MKKEPKEKAPEERHEKPVSVPVPFDEALRRALKVTPPKGGTNKDYVAANRRRSKKS